MAFKLTSMSNVFLMPDKPETFGGPAFLTNTVFLETGERFGTNPNDWLKVQIPDSRSEAGSECERHNSFQTPLDQLWDEEGFVRSALIARAGL